MSGSQLDFQRGDGLLVADSSPSSSSMDSIAPLMSVRTLPVPEPYPVHKYCHFVISYQRVVLKGKRALPESCLELKKCLPGGDLKGIKSLSM